MFDPQSLQKELNHEFKHQKDLDKQYIKYLYRKDKGRSPVKFNTVLKVSSLYLENLDFTAKHECKMKRIDRSKKPEMITVEPKKEKEKVYVSKLSIYNLNSIGVRGAHPWKSKPA